MTQLQLPHYDLLDLSGAELHNGVVIELHVFSQAAPGEPSVDTMTPFYLSQSVAGYLLSMVGERMDPWLYSLADTFGMAWSGLGWAVSKLFPMFRGLAAKRGGHPIPDLPRGEDPIVHLIHYLIAEVPTQIGGMVLKLFTDESGHVIGGGVQDLREGPPEEVPYE